MRGQRRFFRPKFCPPPQAVSLEVFCSCSSITGRFIPILSHPLRVELQEGKGNAPSPFRKAEKRNQLCFPFSLPFLDESMAAEGPVKALCEEASCSICLDFFRDPVTIPECGHNFCRDCLTRSWGESGEEEASCPQCRGKAQPKSLRPNQQLANMVELIQKLPLLEGKGAGGKGGVCEKHREALNFFCQDDEAPLCLVCEVSKVHKDHEVVPFEEAFQENKAVVSGGKGRICQKHQEPLKLFCKEDKTLICVVCDRSKEHRDHETLPLEEASQEYKDQFCNCLEVLKKERERIVAYKGDIKKESQGLLNQTTGGKEETVAKFRQLHLFLEEQERLLLAQMEEVEKEVAKKRDQRLAELSEALSTLEGLIQEMEEKCLQSASELLQDVRSTLQSYEEKETLENPVTFPLALKWHIWDVCDINHLLEGVLKQLKDTLDSGLHLQKANVILDPNTAHSHLILSEDLKSMRDGEEAQASFATVLAREGFTAGRHFWEALVGSEGEWTLGVSRRSVRKKGKLSPDEGIWAMEKRASYKASEKDHYPPQSGELKRIRVCLDYTGGRVAFFDADRAALIYEFTGACFSGDTLLPIFGVLSKGHLKISS